MSTPTKGQDATKDATTISTALRREGRLRELMDMARSYGCIKRAAKVAKDQAEASGAELEAANTKLEALYSANAKPEDELYLDLERSIKVHESCSGVGSAALAASVDMAMDALESFEEEETAQAAPIREEVARAKAALKMRVGISEIYSSAERAWAANVADVALSMLDD